VWFADEILSARRVRQVFEKARSARPALSHDGDRQDDRLGGDELRAGEACETTAGHYELVERAGLNDPACVEYKDTGCLAHRG